MAKRYVLVDGSGFIFRAFYALPEMTRPSDKMPVNAVYGFCTMLAKLLETVGADDVVVVVFDAARKNFRNDIYPEYKANRLETPDALKPQFAYIRKAAEAFSLPVVEQIGYEADDIICAYSHEARRLGTQTVIYSSDKDLMQLLATNVEIYDPLKSRFITPEIVAEKFGVAPEKIPDIQALIGDSSDNIPGVKGIGPKTAAELINQYGSLERLLELAKNIKQDKRRETLIAEAETARLSKRLATLACDMPLDAPLTSFTRPAVDRDKLAAFFHEMEFKSLLNKINTIGNPKTSTHAEHAPQPAAPVIPASKSESSKHITKSYSLISTREDLEKFLAHAREKKIIAIDTETTGLDALTAKMVGFSLATEEGAAAYVPLNHLKREFAGASLFDAASAKTPGQMDEAAALEILKPLLADPTILKVGHNIKYDMHILNQYGLCLNNIADTMVQSYVLDGTKNLHNMDTLAQIHLGLDTIKYDSVVGKGGTFADVALDAARDYAAEDADIALRLYNLFARRLAAEDTAQVYAKIDMPIVEVLFDMEENGIEIDTASLMNLSAELDKEMQKFEAQIIAAAGQNFNVMSPAQLAEILFDKMNIPSPTKNRSTDAEVLRELANNGVEIAATVLKFREYAKLKNTYADVLPKSRNPRDGRVHTSFFQAGTNTGRLSSSDPNLQNIPIRNEFGQLIRSAFVAAPGKKLLSADYSQIDLRVLAQVANVAKLKQAFLDGVDIHSRTASEIFNIPINQITPDYRRKAKAINFGIVYGMSAFGLAKTIDAPQSEAKFYIDSYFGNYPEIEKYMSATKQFAHSHGYVETVFGRKCYIPNINNPRLRGYGERAAINAPIQGGTADVMKIAMRKVYDRLRSENLTGHAKMLLQIHDEIVLEVDDAYTARVAKLVKEEMESVVKWDIPLLASVAIGDNWCDAK
ncbi:MAG: DNA polymerase I [Alphaproteobacteria bacterium]|nr:DNA polymerase I [Alphaproteobacteria bacterium]